MAHLETDGEPGSALSRCKVIHSGHFMVSCPHRDWPARAAGYDFDTVNKQTCRTYRFGPRSSRRLSIDASLTRLLECMTLAYSGKLVSPKWKSFKGLRLLWRDKIRLNNAIWRAWYIQYVERRKTHVCGFITPLETDEHHKPEAIVLEGNYWKRRIEVVIKEYHKWRIYFKKQLQKNKEIDLSSLAKEMIIAKSVEKWSNHVMQDPVPMEERDEHLLDLDYLLSDISDTLFTMTQNSHSWTNSREVAYTSNADMIQPDLTPLQPNLDEFMDLNGFFSTHWAIESQSSGSSQEHYLSSDFSNTPFAAATPTFAPEDMLRRSLSPQTDGLLHHGNRLAGAITLGTISNQLINGLTVPLHITDSHCDPLHSGLQFRTQSHSQQESQYLPSDKLAVELPCMSACPSPLLVTPHIAINEQEPACSLLPLHRAHLASSVSTHSTSTQLSQYPPPIMLPPTPSTTPSSTPTLILKHMAPLFKEQSTRSRSRPNHWAVSTKSEPPASSAPLQNTILPHLQDTGKEAAVATPWRCLPNQTAPALPNFPPTEISDFPRNVLLKATQVFIDQPTPPSYSHSFLIPKAEILSTNAAYSGKLPSLSVNIRCSSELLSPTNTQHNPSQQVPHSTLGRGRSESNKHESRRITHISAEQKRRFNIKLGFDTLHNLLTTLSSQHSVKVSKASTLRKTAEYISKLQQERTQLQEELKRIQEDIEELNAAINVYQQQLPATGVPITRHRFHHMRELFTEYVRVRTLQNWTFWIFSIIIRPLFESFNGMVSTTSVVDLCRSTLVWLEQHCSLAALRPTVLNSLRQLSTSTSILSDPSLVPEQATRAVNWLHHNRSLS